MKVNSISSNQVFGHDSNKLYMSVLRDASDSDLKYLAYAKASHDVNDRKHRRISDLLYYSVPVAAGVAEAVKPASISRIGRLGLGAKGFLSLAIPFALIALARCFPIINSISWAQLLNSIHLKEDFKKCNDI